MGTPGVDHDLLYGLLALRNGLVDEAGLVTALQSWAGDRSRTLADHLVATGQIDDFQGTVIEELASRVEQETVGDPVVDGTMTLAPRPDPPTVSIGAMTGGGGRFRILRPHARGGLGSVSVALDAELRREVALKQILDRHADDAVCRLRFQIEAEITGGLEHPGIVPVYGMGTDADGRPFYAMRFVRGDSFKDVIDRHHADPGRGPLGLRRLLRHFTDICNAIAYAHGRGVIHRDIKPANVIVGEHGETIVLDWGLAKAVGRAEPVGAANEAMSVASASGASAETMPGSTLGTPAFMSPEQAHGDLAQLGPRSDVYSLGATLYYLLTGRPPAEGKLADVLAAVKRGEIPPPRRIDPAIDRALEAVCRKAMAMRPDDRHGSARELADDVERWMADEPVSAWREPLSRRARRWARRNRTAVTTLAAAVLVALAGTAAVLVVQTQANASLKAANADLYAANARTAEANTELLRSRADVQARYDLALDAIRTFHTGVSRDFLLKEPAFRDLRDRLLGAASDFYGKLGALLGNADDLGSRRALASANFELAGLTAKVGRTADALSAHRAVLAARRALPDRIAVGRSLTEIAGLLEAEGKTDEALASYREAEGVLAALTTPDARSPLADCRSRLGMLLALTGKHEEALAVLRPARAAQEAIGARRELADTVNRIGRTLANMGRPKEAEAAYREAMTIRQGLADESPGDIELRSDLAASHNNVGYLLRQTGRPREAEAELRSAMELWKQTADAYPAVAGLRHQVAKATFNLAVLLEETGRPRDAEALHRRSLEIYRRLTADQPGIPELAAGVALEHHHLGEVCKATGRLAEAEAEYRTSLALQERLIRENPAVPEYRVRMTSTHNGLGILLAESGRIADAEVQFRAELAINRALVDAYPDVTRYRDHLATSHVNLGELLSDTGRTSAAEPEYIAAQSMFRQLADAHPAVSFYRNGLAYTDNRRGLLLAQQGRTSEAEAEHRAAIALYRELSAASPRSGLYRDGLASSLTYLGDALKARDAYDEAMAIRERLVAEQPRNPSYRRLRDELRLRLMDLAFPDDPFAR